MKNWQKSLFWSNSLQIPSPFPPLVTRNKICPFTLYFFFPFLLSYRFNLYLPLPSSSFVFLSPFEHLLFFLLLIFFLFLFLYSTLFGSLFLFEMFMFWFFICCFLLLYICESSKKGGNIEREMNKKRMIIMIITTIRSLKSLPSSSSFSVFFLLQFSSFFRYLAIFSLSEFKVLKPRFTPSNVNVVAIAADGEGWIHERIVPGLTMQAVIGPDWVSVPYFSKVPQESLYIPFLLFREEFFSISFNSVFIKKNFLINYIRF